MQDYEKHQGRTKDRFGEKKHHKEEEEEKKKFQREKE